MMKKKPLKKIKNNDIPETKLLLKTKKYGLVWEDKPEQVAELCKEKLPILTEIKTKEISNDDESPNILIEGDNYHALSVLNYTHKGKIDVIYIDPPYNTGREFQYNDKIIDYDDEYRHSKWLSFMKKRLSLAKKILKKTGVIFISIDDNEMGTLKLLCDQIFGENNFIANIIWQHSLQPKGYSDKFSLHHNYILCFRNSDDFKLQLQERTAADNINYSNPDNDSNGLWRSGDVRNSLYRKNLIFDITTPSGKIIKPPSKGWRWSKQTIQEKIREGEIVFNKNETKITRKIYLKNVVGRAPETIWFGKDVGTTRSASQEIKDLFGESRFDTPKPKELLKKIMKISTTKQSIILDFFAGSGTTGDAILQLNTEDDGNRKFILCTNNENNICTAVCFPRIKQVVNGYINSKNENIKGLGGNLKYFKTDFIDKANTDKNKKKLVDKATELLCIKEDCFDEIKSTKLYKIFQNKSRYISILFEDDAIEPFKKELKKRGILTTVYVFSLDEYDKREEFEDVSELVKLKPIPFEIINTYRRIFR